MTAVRIKTADVLQFPPAVQAQIRQQLEEQGAKVIPIPVKSPKETPKTKKTVKSTKRRSVFRSIPWVYWFPAVLLLVWTVLLMGAR